MNKTVKATLWIFGVFAALSLGVYFAGCGSDAAADGGAEPVVCAKEGDACTGGKCFKTTGTEDISCAPECTTVGDDCTAGSCYYTATGNYCFATGTKAPGEACGAASECVGGSTCLDQDGAMNCYKVCADDAGCDAATCADSTLGFNVCVVEEEA